MTGRPAWVVQRTQAAAIDFANIVQRTSEQFGAEQARVYAETLLAALVALRSGPDTLGVKRREEIGKDIYTLHIARGRRRGRHLLLFRVQAAAEPPVIEVLRILHDAMDLARHVPTSETQPDKD